MNYFLPIPNRCQATTAEAQPEEPAPDQPPAADALGDYTEPEADDLRGIRVGEFMVGSGYCPNLYGHPGIRYHY